MFDDIFSVINDWFTPNQELSFEESSPNYYSNSNDLVNVNYDHSIINDNQLFNKGELLIDFDDYFNDLVNPDYDNSIIPNYEEFNQEESLISSVDYLENLVQENENKLALNSDNPLGRSETDSSMWFFSAEDYYFHEENWDISEFDGVGNPFEDANCWQQQNGQNSCAVVAQMGVFESITGVNLPENDVCEFAEANGWFDPEIGTSSGAVGSILNAVGISTDSYYDADLNDIAEALERGDKIIVGLDANEIWQPIRDGEGHPIEQVDGGHAVWVTGIDQLPDGSIKLILNDSGIPNGQMKVVDAVDFINAWDDFGNQIVIAHNSPPSTIV